MESWIQDLRYAVRQLTKSPGFTAVAVITLALGVGATTAVFSLANWLLLRPVPGVHSPRQIVTISLEPAPTNGIPRLMTFPNVIDLSRQIFGLSGIAGQMHVGAVVVINDTTSQVPVDLVSDNYFEVLGVRPQVGRIFSREEAAAAGTAPVAVISHGFWTGPFAGRPDIVGRTFYLNGRAVSIVGVAPAGFRGTERLGDVDVWLPWRAAAASFGFPAEQVAARKFQGLGALMFGRLKAGTSVARAANELVAATARLAEMHPAENETLRSTVPGVRRGLERPTPALERASASLQLLLGVAAVLVLTAGVNLTNLLGFRSAQRRQEFAVRRALGASDGRLMAMSVAESLLLALLAAGAATGLAAWLVSMFRGLALPGLPALGTVGFDGRVLGFGVLLAVGTALAVGLAVPYLDASRGVSESLQRAGAQGRVRPPLVRSAFMAVQIAASLAMLVGAFLLVATVRNLRGVDVGFDPAVRVYSLGPETMADPSGSDVLNAGRARYQASLLALAPRIKAIPGVQEAGLAYQAPFSGVRPFPFSVPGSDQPVFSVAVSPSYFTAMGIPIVRGRSFTEAEIFAGAKVAVISTSLARAVFGEADPVGKELALASAMLSSGRAVVVLGEVADSRVERLVGPDAGAPLYMPIAAGWGIGIRVVVRSSLPEAALDREVRRVASEIAPSRPFRSDGSLRARIDQTISEQRLFARTLTLLTILAVTLASVGVYSLVAFSVGERRREFGIRIALGAEARQILDSVLRRSAATTVVGIGAGLAGAIGLGRLISSQLFGVTPIEPHVYVLAISLMLLLVLVASIVPARAATKVDPLVALKSE